MTQKVNIKWPLVVIEHDKIYFNYIDLGNYTMFRMCLFKTFNPRRGMWVSIEDKGAFFFAMTEHLHKDYVSEKLFLQGDSGQLADFLNAQLQIDGEMQGNYYVNVINAVELYGKAGESKEIPWHPQIVTQKI